MFKQKTKTILFSSLAFLFVGAFSVFAAWPSAPAGEDVAGWLGTVFNVAGSDANQVSIKGNVIVPSTKNVTAGSFIYSSDASLKTNVSILENALDKVQNLRGVSFDWKKTGEADLGFIAQEVEAVYPDLVETGGDGLKAVKYGNITAILVEAIKAQQAEIEQLKAEIAELKK